jgi:L-threonylcarbamoyladenylate synthase
VLANQVSQAIAIVNHGGVIAYSTETVLGLGCDPSNEDAVNRILWLKNRAVENGLILLVANIDAIQQHTHTLSETQNKRIASTMNTTWLAPPRADTPKWVVGKSKKVAVRITTHTIALKLCASIQGIISTSANISGYKTLINRQEIREWFGPHVDYVIIGKPGTGIPSKIKDLLSGETLR